MTVGDKNFTNQPVGTGSGKRWAAIGAIVVAVLLGLWLGGQVASVLSGNGFAAGLVISGAKALLKAPNPSAGWDSAQPGPALYWGVTTVITAGVLAAVVWAAVRLRRWHTEREDAHAYKKIPLREGMATAADIRRSVGVAPLMARAHTLRPMLLERRPLLPADVGFEWGAMHDVPVMTSVRDAVVVLGPSGAGKGVFVVIPTILRAPGALVVTSIRPDVLTPTLTYRERIGPVLVIAPDGTLDALPQSGGWSFIHGCQAGLTASKRAEVLVSGTSTGVENASYWEEQSSAITKYLLHAAALGGRTLDEFWYWTKGPDLARAAVEILTHHPDGEAGWADGLRGVLDRDPKSRDEVWSGVTSAFSGLDVGSVRAKFDVPADRQLDLVDFIRRSGTLYLVASETDPSSRILQCLVSEMERAGKTIGAVSPGGRCEPPVTLLLDEIANWSPLPQLPAYVSGSGGSGIVTMPVIQSRSQMEKAWGREAAQAIWDAATIKIVLGGLSDADTLRDLSLLTDERDEEVWSTSKSKDGQNVSSSVRSKPVMSAGEIRGMREGTLLVLFKGIRPMLVTATAYYKSAIAAQLALDSSAHQAIITASAETQLRAAFGGPTQAIAAGHLTATTGRQKDLGAGREPAEQGAVSMLKPAPLPGAGPATPTHADPEPEPVFEPMSFTDYRPAALPAPQAEEHWEPRVRPAVTGLLGAASGRGSWANPMPVAQDTEEA